LPFPPWLFLLFLCNENVDKSLLFAIMPFRISPANKQGENWSENIQLKVRISWLMCVSHNRGSRFVYQFPHKVNNSETDADNCIKRRRWLLDILYIDNMVRRLHIVITCRISTFFWNFVHYCLGENIIWILIAVLRHVYFRTSQKLDHWLYLRSPCVTAFYSRRCGGKSFFDDSGIPLRISCVLLPCRWNWNAWRQRSPQRSLFELQVDSMRVTSHQAPRSLSLFHSLSLARPSSAAAR
jgi:hypothetical protein